MSDHVTAGDLIGDSNYRVLIVGRLEALDAKRNPSLEEHGAEWYVDAMEAMSLRSCLVPPHHQ